MKTLSEDRRALHRIPETGCRLPETASYLRGALAEMPCTLLAPWEDAVCAYFDLGKDETVAVRSDMDALPVTERTGLPFASAHPGRMHACGHDGHMAMVLGLARRLAAGEVRPQRNVLLIFEPAEETTGGAAPICATGLLERYRTAAAPAALAVSAVLAATALTLAIFSATSLAAASAVLVARAVRRIPTPPARARTSGCASP